MSDIEAKSAARAAPDSRVGGDQGLFGLSEEPKGGILYHNAARFLELAN